MLVERYSSIKYLIETNEKFGSFVSESFFLLILTQEFVNFLFKNKKFWVTVFESFLKLK